MPRPPVPRIDAAQLEGLIIAAADLFAERVLERINGGLRHPVAVPAQPAPAPPRQRSGMHLLRLPDVLERVPLSKSTLYGYIRAGTFPKPRRLGTTSAWLESEVEAWIVSQLSAGAS